MSIKRRSTVLLLSPFNLTGSSHIYHFSHPQLTNNIDYPFYKPTTSQIEPESWHRRLHFGFHLRPRRCYRPGTVERKLTALSEPELSPVSTIRMIPLNICEHVLYLNGPAGIEVVYGVFQFPFYELHPNRTRNNRIGRTQSQLGCIMCVLQPSQQSGLR